MLFNSLIIPPLSVILLPLCPLLNLNLKQSSVQRYRCKIDEYFFPLTLHPDTSLALASSSTHEEGNFSNDLYCNQMTEISYYHPQQVLLKGEHNTTMIKEVVCTLCRKININTTNTPSPSSSHESQQPADTTQSNYLSFYLPISSSCHKDDETPIITIDLRNNIWVGDVGGIYEPD